MASPVSTDQFRKGIGLLTARGFSVDFDPTLLACDHPYLAAPDAARRADLVGAFDDPQIDAVICARGGYGSMRLLDGLDIGRLAEARKPFVGFSDITALHLALNGRGLATFHGPGITSLPRASDPERATDELLMLLQGRIPRRLVLQGQPGVKGQTGGILVGGNLSLLAACLPTGRVQLPRRCVLLIEEVNEPLYRIDRMLTQLLLGGHLDEVTGFALGSFTGCGVDEKGAPLSPVQVALERLAPCRVPVVAGLPVGHGESDQVVPLGVEVELDGSAGTLAILWPQGA
ncbi:MAG: LD-carboxypeptidase [Bradymonadales bacterium]|nr:LD-carboxypeptidase [Bradymonadales bacterium]